MLKKTLMKHLVSCFLLFPIVSGDGNQIEISGRLKIPDAIFTYNALGKGIPCVVFSGSENLSQNLYPPGLQKHLILIYANPSHMGDDLLRDLSLEDIVDDIEKLRKSLGIKRIAVMGHSMFSLLPLEYALKYPQNISYAILSGATPYYTDKHFSESQKYWESKASEERKNILKDNLEKLQAEDMSRFSEGEAFIKQYIAYTPYRFYDPFFDLTGMWKGVEVNIKFVNHYWGKLLKNFDNTDNYKNIRSPVLIMAGKYDYGAPYYLWDDFKKVMPDLTFKVFENAGHNPMLEIPDEYTATIVEWIKSKKEKP